MKKSFYFNKMNEGVSLSVSKSFMRFVGVGISCRSSYNIPKARIDIRSISSLVVASGCMGADNNIAPCFYSSQFAYHKIILVLFTFDLI